MQKKIFISFIITIIITFIFKSYWYDSVLNAFLWKIFTVIVAISFIVSYKIADFLSNINRLREKSKTDFIFLIIFFLVLFIPLSKIDRSSFSKVEKRPYAKWTPFLTKDKKINYSFGKDFEAWYNDRFRLRKQFISVYNLITYNLINKAGKKYYEKERKMAYDVIESSIILDENTDKLDNILLLTEYFKQKGIDLYVYIVPGKEKIYPHINPVYRFEYSFDYFNDKIRQLNEQGCHILDLTEVLKENLDKYDDYLFFKTDHHWTDTGAFIGYQAIMKEIKKKYKDINVLSIDEYDFFYNKKVRSDFSRKFEYGETTVIMYLPEKYLEKIHDYNYKYFKHKDYDNLEVKVIDEPNKREKYYHYEKGAPYRVILMGTSHNENMTEFIPFTFKDVKRIRTNEIISVSAEEEGKFLKRYEDNILEYKPDIIIMGFAIWNVNDFDKIFDRD